MAGDQREARRARLALVLAALAVLGLSAALAVWTSRTSPVAPNELGTAMVVIPVEGMSCAACAARVRNALTSIDGVSHAEISLAERSARVRFDPTRVRADLLVTAIEDLGYRAGAPAGAQP